MFGALARLVCTRKRGGLKARCPKSLRSDLKTLQLPRKVAKVGAAHRDIIFNRVLATVCRDFNSSGPHEDINAFNASEYGRSHLQQPAVSMPLVLLN